MFLSPIRLKHLTAALVITATALMIFLPNRSGAIASVRNSGSDIFRTRCTVCHGVDGIGHTELGKKLKTPDLRSDEVQKLSDDELLEIIMDGKGEMPGFERKLTRDDIQQVILHLRKLAKEN
jgi:mono/diheme cytochrome c family protein